MLGDINISEPGALIGFAGPRVVKDTTGQDLPKGFQTSEFLLEHGLIDQIVDRHSLRNRLITLISHLGHALIEESKSKPVTKKKTVTKTSTVTRRKAPTKKKN